MENNLRKRGWLLLWIKFYSHKKQQWICVFANQLYVADKYTFAFNSLLHYSSAVEGNTLIAHRLIDAGVNILPIGNMCKRKILTCPVLSSVENLTLSESVCFEIACIYAIVIGRQHSPIISNKHIKCGKLRYSHSNLYYTLSKYRRI